MIELLTAQQRYINRGKTPANAVLNQRKAPNAKTYVSRLGYNTACSSYTGSCEIGRLSGSSLNRLESKRKKNELEKLYQQAKEAQKKICKGTYEYEEYQARLELLFPYQANEYRHKSKLPKSLHKRGLPVHFLSARSKGKVRDKATAFYRSIGTQKTFATLTFIADVDDRTAVSILNKFLTALRADYENLKYMWVGERQENRNIHFHLIINQRLPIRRYNALWVQQQYNAGLRFRDVSEAEINERVKNDTIHEILNPFDVKKIRSIYGLSFYLTKYITKNKSVDGFKCLAWHCSRSVSKLFTRTVISRSTFSAIASWKNSRLQKKTGELIKAKNLHGPFYNLYFIENKYYFLPDLSELEQVNRWILDGMLPDRIPLIDDFDICKFYNN